MSVAEDLKSLGLIKLAPEVAQWVEAHPEERDCVASFVAMMLTELAANDGKGNRPGWLTMTRKEAIAEVHWHAAKLAVSAKAITLFGEESPVRESAEQDVREYAADTANCALMVLDCAALLGPPLPLPDPETGGEG
jgi:hypothetical protein